MDIDGIEERQRIVFLLTSPFALCCCKVATTAVHRTESDVARRPRNGGDPTDLGGSRRPLCRTYFPLCVPLHGSGRQGATNPAGSRNDVDRMLTGEGSRLPCPCCAA